MYSDVVKALKDAGFKVVGERVDEPIPGTIKLSLRAMDYEAETFGKKVIRWTYRASTKAHSVNELESLIKDVAEALYQKFETVWMFETSIDGLDAMIVFTIAEYVE